MFSTWPFARRSRKPEGRRPKARLRRALVRLEALEERCTPTTTFYVNTLNDTHDANVGNGVAQDADGKTSLRAAIEEANAGTGDFVIQIVDLPGTISLGSALPALDRDIWINNNTGSSGLTVRRDSAAGPFRIFEINSGKNVTIGGLRLTNGQVSGAVDAGRGGAILNHGILTVSGCDISVNSADNGGGIANVKATGVVDHARLTLINTVMSNNWAVRGSGGAIWNGALDTVELNTNCLLSGNTAQERGGGIYNWGGYLTVRNSTISQNTAVMNDGGGIHNDASGTLVMEDSTLSSNRCQDPTRKGGGLYTNGSATLTRCTIRDNQAGVGSGYLLEDRKHVHCDRLRVHQQRCPIRPVSRDGPRGAVGAPPPSHHPAWSRVGLCQPRR
jgi:CSLREA domain-containing protein